MVMVYKGICVRSTNSRNASSAPLHHTPLPAITTGRFAARNNSVACLRSGHEWDDAAVLAEKTTPVFFGSASNNFGVQLLLDGFLKHAPGPRGYKCWKPGAAGFGVP